QALTSLKVPNQLGELVDNPLFTDLNPNDNDTNIRDASLVFIAGIVGVPWQDLARDPNNLGLGFKNFDELSLKDNTGTSTWDKIRGDPTNYPSAWPKDPHMIETWDARPGLPTAMSGMTDPINGHEYSIPKHDDLQYACIFDLPTSRDCSNAAIIS